MVAPARKDHHWQLGAIRLTKSDALSGFAPDWVMRVCHDDPKGISSTGLGRTSAQTHFCTWQTYHSDSWQSLERATASSAQHRQHVSNDQRGYLLSLVVEEAGLYRAQVTLAINGAKKTCCGPRHPSRFQAVSDLQRSQAALCMIWTHIECIGSRPWHKISCEPKVISSTYRMHRA